MKGITGVILFIGLMVALPGLLSAQDEGAAPEAEYQEAEYGDGSVVKVNAKEGIIVVKEYDWEIDGEVDIVYTISTEATFINISSLAGIKPGDYVEFEYLIGEDGEKIIKFISATELEFNGETEF